MVVRSGAVGEGMEVTILEAASPAIDRIRSRLRQADLAFSWHPERSWLGPLLTLAVALVLTLLRANGIRFPDPAPILLLPVVASALAGRNSGLVAAGIAGVASLIHFASPPFVGQPDNALRVMTILLMLPVVAVMVGTIRDRLAAGRDELVARRLFGLRLGKFSAALTKESVESVYAAFVERVPDLISCDLVALTLADPRDGRHFVRAVHGADPSLVGVEIMPGVGVAGQAIRDRRVVVAERLEPAAMAASESATASTVAGAPVIADGRVMASLTFGRTSDARPFSPLEREAMEAVAGTAATILRNAELRGELSESALRDPVTNLYNRTYLEAGLDQLLALRRRMAPQDRRPMAAILFDIDGFRRFNEEHGRADGDRVLHAISGVLRSRFRASDTLARIGGDGFFVVMDGATRADATNAAAEVRERVRALLLTTTRGEPVKTSVSAGCATFVDADPGAQAVIRTVEAALDTARWSGKDAVVSI